jgi:polyhydroxybutyrate depolymerase
MKKLIVFGALCTLSSFAMSQVSSESFVWDGQTREYNLYIPSSYSVGDTVPLVFCLHGMGDTGPNFMNTGFNTVADTANFIAVYPTALIDRFFNATAWNCGTGNNPTVDDPGFFYALIDTINKNYPIDMNRIHATGFSLGGFMSNRMACEMSDKIASIASVSGTIGVNITCAPSRPVPMMHMHGTNDNTIAWDGTFNSFQVGQGVDTMIETWKTINNCPGTATQTALPDIASDGYTIDHFDYSPCDEGSEVELYKINGADHVWMFTNNDVDSRVEIWRFFHRNPMPPATPVLDVAGPAPINKIQLTPNPASELVNIVGLDRSGFPAQLGIYDLSGRSLITQHISSDADLQVDLLNLETGMYILRLSNVRHTFSENLIITR